VIEARGGTYREVGKQIGAQAKPQILNMLAYLRENVPAGFSWDQMLDHSKAYLAPSRVVYPQYVEELEGIAEGSGVSFEDVFVSMCEELWESPVLHGCTDMAARGRATVDGTTLIAHTNDLSLSSGTRLVILKIQAGDEPEILAVSPGGVAISAGYNAAKISLTGNQLDSNDTRPGVSALPAITMYLPMQVGKCIQWKALQRISKRSILRRM
jgi:isopenicillin-N N-acyltransferase-like protein